MLTKKLDTEEDRQWWAHAFSVSAEVAAWPKWKRDCDGEAVRRGESMKVRRRVVDTVAMQWHCQTTEQVKAFCGSGYTVKLGTSASGAFVLIVEGYHELMRVYHNDWLVREEDRIACYANECFRLAYKEVESSEG